LSSVTYLAVLYVSTFSYKRHDLKKKLNIRYVL
jgi:hypothetical protein